MKYSVIIPVYNRPNEVEELLESLSQQVVKNFDIVIVEDGSTETCKEAVDARKGMLDIQYYFKTNTGPGDSRNFGMERARGDYFLFFDSDCLIPPDYFQKLDAFLAQNPTDLFGGPDREHSSFTRIQKAINYAMTSFLTTGGIRGKKKQIGKFQPRSFNMGLSREVYQKVGGFGTIHPGEDPDLSIRIVNAGFQSTLIPDLFVYHNRRIDFSKFYRQVYKFGVVRNILFKWHPQTLKLVFFLPSFFLVGSILLVLLGIFVSVWFFLPFVMLVLVLLLDALIKTGSLAIALLAIGASFIQLYGYGWGFIKSFTKLFVFKKDERVAFPEMFFE